MFIFSAQFAVSAYTLVEAPNRAAAMEIAEERTPVIGGPNSGHSEKERWIVEGVDGWPDNIRLSHDSD